VWKVYQLLGLMQNFRSALTETQPKVALFGLLLIVCSTGFRCEPAFNDCGD